MKLCEVVGTVVATIKRPDLRAHRLLLVREIGGNQATFVAADVVGAGKGQHVLVSRGTAARVATGDPSSSCDAAIVGILDDSEAVVDDA